ncbi:MAG: T9SS type A sorting domain-containing protein [Ignavibacteriaceae bacterium]|nr:T9SS type A sorting domain-containing protein [Ignavibacteriaceae bacterium]
MKRILLQCLIFFYLPFYISFSQEPLSYFPHSIGNRWDYDYWNGNTNFYTTTITRDSLSQDSSKFLFYDNESLPRYKIDTSLNVYLDPYVVGSEYLIYKLEADSGDVWFNNPEWAWVAGIDTGYVFSNLTTIKVYQYGPAHPDSTPFPYILRERWLASGFGLIYEWEEPGYFYSLKGCIVEGDTFGIITNVELKRDKIPRDFTIKQNYPNPFNPSTTIEFILPEEAEISLRIYDILGRQVSIIYEGVKEAGIHRYHWNASGLASGIYFCRLNAFEGLKTIKMLLTK